MSSSATVTSVGQRIAARRSSVVVRRHGLGLAPETRERLRVGILGPG
jgi:hypothetical protein